MNENMLVTLDDAALESVNGGASLILGVGDTEVVNASASLVGGLTASLKLFGEKIFNFSFKLFS